VSSRHLIDVLFTYRQAGRKFYWQCLKIVMSWSLENKYMKNAVYERRGGSFMKREAIFDETGTYRYSLSRTWDESNGRKVTFILLHPGTADEHKEDATASKCILLAKRWGFGSLEIVTLFAYQTNRFHLLNELTKEEAVGYDNDRYIQYALADADLIVAGWGENSRIHGRDADLPWLLEGRKLVCLGTVHPHYPRHPLFVPYNVMLESFYVSPVSFQEEREEAAYALEAGSFDPYEASEPVRRRKEVHPFLPPDKEEDGWIFCTMCYDDYPMHGEAVCHSCYEQKMRVRTPLNEYDYMI
jgi:hypothetical protein